MRNLSMVLLSLLLYSVTWWNSEPASAQHWVENSSLHQWTPSVAFNPSQNEWWSSYVDHDGVNPYCTPANSCSANATARAFTSGGGFLRERVLADTLGIPDKDPYLVHNPHKNEFLAVWYDNAQGTVFNGSCDLRADIKGRILDRWGNPISGVLDISSNHYYNQAFPRAAYDKAARAYMVVWQELSTSLLCSQGFGALTSGPWRIRGRVLYDNGANKTGTLLISNQDSNQERPDIVAHNTQDKFMVVWQDRRHGTAHIMGQMFRSNGSKYFPNYELIVGFSDNGNKNSRNPKVTYNYQDDEFVAVWTSAENGYISDGYVYANRMRGSDGGWLDWPVKVSDGVSNEDDNEWADITYCPATQQYWISWERADSPRKPRIGRFSRSLSRNWWTTLSNNGKAVSLPDVCRYDGQIMAVWEEWNLNPWVGTPSIRAQFFW